MKKTALPALALLSAFALAGCEKNVSENAAYCVRTGENSFKVVNTDNPDIIVAEATESAHRFNRRSGRVESHIYDGIDTISGRRLTLNLETKKCHLSRGDGYNYVLVDTAVPPPASAPVLDGTVRLNP